MKIPLIILALTSMLISCNKDDNEILIETCKYDNVLGGAKWYDKGTNPVWIYNNDTPPHIQQRMQEHYGVETLTHKQIKDLFEITC